MSVGHVTVKVSFSQLSSVWVSGVQSEKQDYRYNTCMHAGLYDLSGFHANTPTIILVGIYMYVLLQYTSAWVVKGC